MSRLQFEIDALRPCHRCKSLYHPRFTALCNDIQEVQQENDTLKGKIDLLEEEVASFKAAEEGLINDRDLQAALLGLRNEENDRLEDEVARLNEKIKWWRREFRKQEGEHERVLGRLENQFPETRRIVNRGAEFD